MELSFQPVLRPGRLKPELRTHRKDQENAEVLPGSAGILRALLIIAKPSARWKRALPGKCSSVVSSLVSFLTASERLQGIRRSTNDHEGHIVGPRNARQKSLEVLEAGSSQSLR